jgi:hypothetical protein
MPLVMQCSMESFVSETDLGTAALYRHYNYKGGTVMPFLIPVLIGIPVLFGGGYVIYHLAH